MGFTVKIEDINNRSIMKGLEELSKKEFPATLSWNISRMKRQLLAASKELVGSFEEIIKKYSKKDENGKILPVVIEPEQKDESGKVIKEAVIDRSQFNIVDGQEESYAKDMHEFMQSESPVIESRKIKLSEIIDYKLKAETLTQLEPVIEEDLNEEENKPSELKLV
jgi:hypothetical protein